MIEIWPQEVFYLAGILILAAIILFFVTSLFGRIWCGYACPQTVWTDLFVAVENLIQGDRNQRIKLDAAPWNLEKIYKKTLTHILWILIGALTGGAWVLYFNDAHVLLYDVMHANVPLNILLWIGGLTTSTYIMAGFAREKVCTQMCPYARFQAAMFDPETLVIGYDQVRGEPRGKKSKDVSAITKPLGDCIDCGKCTVVCPQGIDIRDGLQMSCIACGLCIDACNDVMTTIDRPLGLIRYDTDDNLTGVNTVKQKPKLLRPRSFYYSIIISVVSIIMLYSLMHRPPFFITLEHERNPLYTQLSNGEVRNDYFLRIINRTHTDAKYTINLQDLDGIVKISGSTNNEILLKADDIATYRVFIIKESESILRKDFNFVVSTIDKDYTVNSKSYFIAPSDG
jgi:cytochrome c oxidase accessory protein FixG